MRHRSIVPRVVPLLVALLVTGSLGVPVSAQEGVPGDFCSFSPDHPLGWNFSPACEQHDLCIGMLTSNATLQEHLSCDTAFRVDLLATTKAGVDGVCDDSILCSVIANAYFVVVRFITVASYTSGR